MKISDNIVEGM